MLKASIIAPSDSEYEDHAAAFVKAHALIRLNGMFVVSVVINHGFLLCPAGPAYSVKRSERVLSPRA